MLQPGQICDLLKGMFYLFVSNTNCVKSIFFVHRSILSFSDLQEIFEIFKPSLIKIIIIIAVFVSIFRVYNTYLLASFNLCGCFSVVSHCARAVGH